MSIHQYKHLLQSINSQIWSFSEIGYQEFQTVKLLTRTLELLMVTKNQLLAYWLNTMH